MTFVDDFSKILPGNLVDWLHTLNTKELTEILLHVGSFPAVRFGKKLWDSLDDGTEKYITTQTDIDSIVCNLPKFNQKNRAAMDARLHRVSAIRNVDNKIIGLTIRVGKDFPGLANIFKDLLEGADNIIIISPPGLGKSSILRDISRLVAEELHQHVCVIDYTNELAGNGDVPHPSVGPCTRFQVPVGKTMADVMLEAVENHNPDVVICDEISTYNDVRSAQSIAARGVKLIATAHGVGVDSLLNNPVLKHLAGNVSVVTLGDSEMKTRDLDTKNVTERELPPTFSCAIEIKDFDNYNVYRDLETVIDALLAKKAVVPEKRLRHKDGTFAVLCKQSISN